MTNRSRIRPGWWLGLALLAVLLVAGLSLAPGVRPAAASTAPSVQALTPTGLTNPEDGSIFITAEWASPQGSLFVAYNNWSTGPSLYQYTAAGAWTQLQLPSGWGQQGYGDYIMAIGGVSDTQVYATDYNDDPNNSSDVQMWNGTVWSGPMITSDGDTTLTLDSLCTVVSGSGYDIYAGGSDYDSYDDIIYQLTDSTTNTWTNLSCPQGNGNIDYGVRGLWGDSPGDLFAVDDGGGILHWDGSKWTSNLDNAAANNWDALDCVWGTSSSDVYAGAAGGTGILHWDGTAWTVMTGTSGDHVSSITGTGDSNIYALGNDQTGDHALLHYDGAAWTTILDISAAASNPNPSGNYCYLTLAPGGDLFAGDNDDGNLLEIIYNCSVTGVSLNQSSDTIPVIGDSTTLTATFAPSYATDQNVTWTTSDATVAGIVYSGLDCTVTGLAPGTATITVTTGDGGYAATCDVTVQEGVPTTGVSLDKTSDTITVRGSDTLTATVAPDNATDQNVTWTTRNATVATVVYNAATGGATITGLAPGTAAITATTVNGGYTASCQVTVQTVAATGVTLDKTSDTISAGGSDTLTATMVPADATDQNVTWTTSDAAVAPITAGGTSCTVGGLAPGTATITATTEDGSHTATCLVTITAGAVQNTLFQPGYGDGSSANPYLIATAGDLVLLAKDVNAGTSYGGQHFKLANDIDLSSVCGAVYGNWTPIGANNKAFSGTLDGNSCAIENLYISTSTADAQNLGLFANVTNATIENLTVSGSIQITNDMYVSDCAGIAANTTGSTFQNCVNRVNITIDQNTWMCSDFGGIVGSGSSVTISGCTNYGNITGNSDGGGIAGVTGAGDNVVENCANHGNLISTSGGEYAGIMGMADAHTLISGCANYGAISSGLYSQGYLAGIIATSQASTTVTNCTNQGSISGSDGYTGGIAANSSPPTGNPGGGYIALTGCSNSGSVTDTSSTGPVGGIIANCANDSGFTDVTGCSNSGAVTGLSDVGGLVGTLLMYNGSSPLILSGSYNTGPVTGTSGGSADSSIGGLVGYADQYYGTSTNSGGTFYYSYSSQPIFIENCYNTGAVTAPNTPDVGGLIGSANSNGASSGITLANCYNAGSVSGASQTGGLAGLLTTVSIVSKSGQVTDEFAPLTIENCYSASPSVTASVYAGAGIGQIAVYSNPDLLTISNVFARSYNSLAGIGGDSSGTDPCGVTTLSDTEMKDPSFVTLLGGAFADWTSVSTSVYQPLYGSYPYPVLLDLCGLTPGQTYNVQFAGAKYTTVQTGGVDTYATTVAPGGSRSFTVTSDYPDNITVESVTAGGNTLTAVGGVYTVSNIQANTVVTVTTEGTPPASLNNDTVNFDVTDANGNAISGATIAVTGQSPGSDGSYSMPAGTYNVSIAKTSYTTVSGSFTVSVAGTVYATLYQGSACTLTLKTGSDGYYVNLYDGSILLGSTAGTTTEDADGYYDTSFSLPAGSYTYTATGTTNSEPWSGAAMGSGPLKITGAETVTMRLLDFTDGGGQFSNPGGINYSMTLSGADGTQYFPGSASAASGADAAGYFVLPASAEGAAYSYAFLPVNSSYWGDSGTTYLYDMPTGQFFASLNLSDSFGQFIITPKATLTITAPTGAELGLYRRVKFYQPLEQLQAKSTQDNGDGTTTYSYDAPANYNYLHYELRMAGYVKKANSIDASSVSIPLSSLTVDAGQDLPDSQNYAADIVMNAPDSKYITLSTGQQFQLYLYRNWQAISSGTMNYYVDPDYNVQVISGDSVQITDPYYAGATIEAVQSGVSIVRITYGPLDYFDASGNPHVYSKLWEQNTVLLVVNVNPAGSATINPGIPLEEFDTVYYTRSINGVERAASDQYAEYTFTPTVTNGTLASVSLHAPVGSTEAWDDTAWTNLTANADGSYTAKLTDGRSIIRISAADGTVSYFVVKAYGVNVTIAGNNVQTKLNGRQFQVSADTGSAQVSYDGLEMPFPKLGAIYNPGFGGQTYLVYTVDDPTGTAVFVYSETTQYDIAGTNTVTLNLANPGAYDLTGGSIHTSSIGAGGGTHRYMTEGGLVGNLQYTYTGGNSSTSVNGLFCVLPDIDIQAVNPAAGISLDKTSDTIAAGNSDQLTATVTPTGAGDQGLTWTSSDPSVATMVYSGATCTVTGVTPGNATITVTTADGSYTATCAVTVQAAIAVTGVSLDKTTDIITTGDSDTLTASITPFNASNQNLTWTTSDSSVATVVYSGATCTVTGVTPGNATITVTTADGSYTAACAVTVQNAAAGSGSAWPQFHNTVDNAGYSTSTAPSNGNIAWTATVSPDPSSSPVVANGMVYIYSCSIADSEATSSAVYCLNETTGAIIWNTPVATAQDGSWSSPAYDNGMVFIGSGQTEYCLDATSGKILWSYALHNPAVNGSPRVAGGCVFQADWSNTGSTSYLYSLNENTGALNWEYPLAGYCEATPAYDNGDIFVNNWKDSTGANSGGDSTYCLNAATGALIWHQSALRDISIGGPTVADGKVFVDTYNFGGDGELAALDETTGNILWVAVGPDDKGTETGLNEVDAAVDIQRTDATPAYYDGKVYLSGGCYGYSKLDTYCFDAATGVLLWDEPASLKNSVGNWTCSPAVADDMVFVGEPVADASNNFDYSGLYALNAATGSVVWNSPYGGSTPAVSDGMIFSAQGDNLYAFASFTGTVPVTGVSLSKTTDTITVGSGDVLTATIAPSGATNQALTWSSSDPSVASVVYSGDSCTVTGISAGNATITVTTADGSFTATCQLTVQAGSSVPVTGVSLNKTTDTITVGSGDALTATIAPSTATDQALTWSSSNPSVASVVYNGASCTITGISAGNATITVTTADGSFTATCQLTVQAGSSAPAQPWPQFQADQDNSGVTSGAAPVSKVDVAWKQQVGTISMDGIDEAPLAAGGDIYVLDALGKAWAFDARTGNKVWSTQLSETGQSFQLVTPAYDSGYLYVATNDGHVYKLSGTDGSIAWTEAMPIAQFSQVATTVKCADGRAYVGAWNSSSSTPEYYYCLNESDGSPGIGSAYKLPNTASDGGYYWAGACIVGSDLIFGSDQSTLTCLDEGTGAVVSSVNLKNIESGVGPVRSSVSYDPATNSLFLTDKGGCCWAFSLNPDTGALTYEWHTQIGYSTSTPAIYGGRIYVGTGGMGVAGSNLVCLDEATGGVIWNFQANGPVQASPAISVQNGAPYIYFSTNSANAQIYCLDQNGNQMWQFAVQETGSGSYTLQGVAIANGWLYFGNDGGYLYALEPATITVTGVTLNKSSDTIAIGASDTLTATIAPSTATDQTLAWSSSITGVATVVYDATTGAATITAVSPGTATITAAASDGSGISATCQVTVTAASDGGGGGSTNSAYDLNGDGQVNVLDLILIGQHFGQTGTPGWIKEDVNDDGTVNVLDLLGVYQHFTS